MKIIFSEYNNDYSTYTFSYSVYAIREENENLDEIYNHGFCPYTGDLTIEEEIFYLARSTRVNLLKFYNTSENNRVNKKIDHLNIKMEVHEKKKFKIDRRFIDFCLNYAKERFTSGSLSRERLNYIFTKNYFTHIISFKNNEDTLGYVFCSITKSNIYYWYCFFNTKYFNYSIGKWIMWRTISWAKEQTFNYVYLGTCYSLHSLYKIRDHKGSEYFNGISWSTNLVFLKKICTNDNQFKSVDILKDAAYKKQLLNHIFMSDNKEKLFLYLASLENRKTESFHSSFDFIAYTYKEVFSKFIKKNIFLDRKDLEFRDATTGDIAVYGLDEQRLFCIVLGKVSRQIVYYDEMKKEILFEDFSKKILNLPLTKIYRLS